MHCGFMDSRLRRFPPDRASAVPYGQAMDNAMRCPPLAHRSAAAHKLHSARSNRYKIRESQNQNPGTGLSLFQPGGCLNDRDHRTGKHALSHRQPRKILKRWSSTRIGQFWRPAGLLATSVHYVTVWLRCSTPMYHPVRSRSSLSFKYG